MELMEHQLEAARQLSSGKILYGGVGTGKTATVLAYYVDNEEYRDIYVITTARKRDSLDWEKEAARFGISTEVSCYGRLHVDSWNNISNYEGVTGAFFVFDEQRVVGDGAWVRSFLKITKREDGERNHWVLLSATPGDNWLDYAPVFIANGFYRNITEFKFKHVIYESFVKYPKVKGYLNEERLEELRNDILVEMPYLKRAERILNWWPVAYDKDLFKRIWKDRWNIYDEQPIRDIAELFRLMRRFVNSDPSRFEELLAIHAMHPRLIVFYNFDYELEILRALSEETNVFEWNGHRKNRLDEFEDLDRWVYLVQYVSGAEAWNCTSTNAVLMYSLTYSYKNFEQCQGRIDRMNTEFDELFYYIFVSDAIIDKAIKRALEHKETFNERKAIREISRNREELDELEVKYRVDSVPLEVCEIG